MQLWTYEHAITVLPGLAIMAVLAVVLRKFLKDKPHHIRMIPISVIAVILVLLEIGKQGTSLRQGYDLYCLPFHFCSLFIFMLPLMAFWKGKGAKTVSVITTALCMSVFLIMLIYPNLIYPSGSVQSFTKSFMSFHTVVFHLLVMLSAVLILALGLYAPMGKHEIKAVFWFIVIFCAVSASMAHILKTNYANFYVCNIPILEQLRQTIAAAVGAVPAKLFYIVVVTLVNVVFVYGAQMLCRLVYRLQKKATAVAAK